MEVMVVALGSPSLISLMVSVGVKQHERRKRIERRKKSRFLCFSLMFFVVVVLMADFLVFT